MPRPKTATRRLRADTNVRSAARIIEQTYGLPDGSVRLLLPHDREPRSDQTIGRLRERWEAAESEARPARATRLA